jgi:hypothetical protein
MAEMICKATGKHMYHSKDAALHDLHSWKHLPGDTLSRIYRCRKCVMWHTTSKPYRPSRHLCLETMRFKFANHQEANDARWEVGREDTPYRCKKCRQLHFEPELAPPGRENVLVDQ